VELQFYLLFYIWCPIQVNKTTKTSYHFTKVRFPFPIAIERHPIYLSYRGFCFISWTVAMRANVVFSKSSLIFKGYGYKKMTRHTELLQHMPGCVPREYNTILFWSINTAVELLSLECIKISGTIHTIYRNHSEFLFSLP
jgi:hypothetical protein